MARPNILWICTDQQRFDTLESYGNDYVNTPNTNRLSQGGVQFENCFSQSPVCTPSRASFLTGRYPRTTGCRQNGQSIAPDELLLPKIFSNHGYTTGLSGKLHLSATHPEKQGAPAMSEKRIDDGYDLFSWSHDPDAKWPTNEYQLWLRENDVQLERTPVQGSQYTSTSISPEHHQTTWCCERAIDFIEESKSFSSPWLFSVNIFDPHHPFDPPEEYLEPYLDKLDKIPLPNYEPGELDNKPIYQKIDHDSRRGLYTNYSYEDMDAHDHKLMKAAYWAMCDQIDYQVGKLLDSLEETDQRDNTIIVFTSDHGEMLGDHGIYLKGPYFYDPAIRVPMIINGPQIESGVKIDGLTELSDIAPTLLDAANIPRPDRMQAQSLWPIVTGKQNGDEHRDSVYCEYYNAMPRHSNMDIVPFGTMIRTDQYKLTVLHHRGTGELYDLNRDPQETLNHWSNPKYSETKSDLLLKMTDRMAETVDPEPVRQARY